MATVTASWNGATADWSTPSDWSDGIVPNNSNTEVVLPGTSAYTVTISSGQTFVVGPVLISNPSAILGLHNGAGAGHGASLTVNGGFTNSGVLDVDNATAFDYSEGGSNLTITGTLDNLATTQIGSTSLNAATTVTLGALINGSGVSFALDGSSSHAATLAFSGTGFTSNGGNFQLDFAAPLILGNSFTNSGTFGLHNDTTLTVNGGFTNSGVLDVDNATAFDYSEGGSNLTITGTLDNLATTQIGSTSLNAATTVTLGALINGSGVSFALDGSSSHAATLAFSGTGFTSNGGNFQLDFAAPLILGNSFTNSGTFGLHNDTTLTVNGGFTNSGVLDVDNATAFDYSEGGSNLTITGTLDNLATTQIGSTSLNAATTVTLGKLTNASHATIALDGSASHAATMTVTGTAQNTGTINLTDGTLTVGGAISGTGTYNLGAGAALALLGGGSLTGAINGFGTLEIEGTKTVSITHTAVLGVPTVIQAGKVALAASVAFTNAAGHTWDINGPTGVTETLSGGSGASFTNSGTFEGTGAGTDNVSASFVNLANVQLSAGKMVFINALTNNGTMTVAGSTLQIDKTVAGTGLLDIGNTGTLTLDAGATSGSIADFLTNNGLLNLQKPLSFAGTIEGFALGDKIDLLKTTETGFSFNNGVLTVTKGTATVASLNFAGTYTTASFNLGSDGHAGTFVTHT